MRTLRLFVLLVFAQMLFIGAAFAQEHGTAEEAKALVGKGLAHIKAVGIDKAAEDINANKDGKWLEKDLYIVIIKNDGTMVAHGSNKILVGKNTLELKDPNGKFFTKESAEAAKKGGGWVDYMFTNPATKKLSPKSMYSAPIPGFDGFIGVGIYK